jgi:hypothetical protein
MRRLNGFRVDQASQKYFTVWGPAGPNPGDGCRKYTTTRLGFGFTNSPAIMQQYYDRAKQEMERSTLDRLANFYDDFRLNSPLTDDVDSDFEVFLRAVGDFLDKLIEFAVELSPKKTVFGRVQNLFYGFKIYLSGKNELSDHNLAAVRALEYPSNPAEVGSVMGLFTQYRAWIPNFSNVAAPLHRLKKKGVLWDFDIPESTAFESLRKSVLQHTANYSPDYSYPFISEADASDYGIGGRLFQQIGDEQRNIGYWSRSLSASERKLPVYFRECIAMVEGVQRARIYALSSPFPLTVRTDQRSLVFAEKLEKGPLTAFVLASISDRLRGGVDSRSQQQI